MSGRRASARQALAPLLAAVFGLLALGLVVFELADGEEPALEVSRQVLVNEPGQIEAHNSPDIARSPDGEALVVVHRLDRPGFSAKVQSSVDGGLVWLPAPLQLPEGLDRPFAPDAGYLPDGTLVVTYVDLTGPGNVPNNLWVATSSDDGATFSAPVAITGSLAFQARSTVDQRSGTIYVTWLQADEVGLLQFVGSPKVMLARSTDGGATFDAPVVVSDAERERVGAAVPAVLPDGSVLVVYMDFADDRRDFENQEGPPYEEPFTLVVARSDDGGATFGSEVVIDDQLLPTRRFLPFLPEFPSVAVGPGGRVHVAWADGRNGDLDVFTASSTDGGASWSGPARVNTNEVGDGTSQYLPAISVAPDGRLDVLFYDRSADPTDTMMETTFATSDDGRDFDTVTASPLPFDSRIGSSAAGFLEPDFGSRLAISSVDDGAFAAWTDTQLGSPATGRQDIVAASIAVNDSASLLGRLAPAALALLAGLAALAVWRRGAGSTPGRS